MDVNGLFTVNVDFLDLCFTPRSEETSKQIIYQSIRALETEYKPSEYYRYNDTAGVVSFGE